MKYFTIKAHSNSPRLQVITLSKQAINTFNSQTEDWDLTSLEYKPFLRFAVANALDKACEFQLKKTLKAILSNREQSAILIETDETTQQSFKDNETQRAWFVKLSTAISHLIGVPNFDAMYGKYYARFTVKNTDNSDSYLRKAHRRMELHNDGTYVDERTDFVLMMKMDEKNMQGGDSLLLHLDDWKDLNHFYNHPIAKKEIIWQAPPSKNVTTTIKHPVFFEEDKLGKPHMLFIDQFAMPQNMAEGLYLQQLSESLERDPSCFHVRVNIGSMLLIQNHVWVHGRDKFENHPKLERELLRQRGIFTEQ